MRTDLYETVGLKGQFALDEYEKISYNNTAQKENLLMLGVIHRIDSGMYWFRRGFKSRRSEPHEMR